MFSQESVPQTIRQYLKFQGILKFACSQLVASPMIISQLYPPREKQDC